MTWKVLLTTYVFELSFIAYESIILLCVLILSVKDKFTHNCSSLVHRLPSKQKCRKLLSVSNVLCGNGLEVEKIFAFWTMNYFTNF